MSSFTPTLKSYMGTNQVTTFKEMSAMEKRNAIQQMANTDALISAVQKTYGAQLIESRRQHSEQLRAMEGQKREMARANDLKEREIAEMQEQIRTTREQTTEIKMLGRHIIQQTNVIYQGFNTLDLSLKNLIRHQEATNIGIDNIIKAIGVPEFERERLYYITEGFKYLGLIGLDERKREDAIHFFEQAYNISDRDALVAYNLGVLAQHNPSGVNFEKAKQYLDQALEYAITDSGLESLICSELAFNAVSVGDVKAVDGWAIRALEKDNKNIDGVLIALDVLDGIDAAKVNYDILFRKVVKASNLRTAASIADIYMTKHKVSGIKYGVDNRTEGEKSAHGICVQFAEEVKNNLFKPTGEGVYANKEGVQYMGPTMVRVYHEDVREGTLFNEHYDYFADNATKRIISEFQFGEEKLLDNRIVFGKLMRLSDFVKGKYNHQYWISKRKSERV